MAKIKIISDRPLVDGMTVTFRAPCECSAVDGLTVSYLGVAQSFTFRDAHCETVDGLGNLFSEGALVKAVLDVTNGGAYIQNADTNSYLEWELENRLQAVELWKNASPDSTFYQQTISLDLGEYSYVSIYFRGFPAAESGVTVGPIPKGSKMTMQYITTAKNVLHRHVTATDTGVEFGAGQANGEASNTAPVPLIIYGWKGVKRKLQVVG